MVTDTGVVAGISTFIFSGFGLAASVADALPRCRASTRFWAMSWASQSGSAAFRRAKARPTLTRSWTRAFVSPTRFWGAGVVYGRLGDEEKAAMLIDGPMAQLEESELALEAPDPQLASLLEMAAEFSGGEVDSQ